MKKHKEYYYTVKVTGYKERNNSVAIKMYSWFIRNKSGKVLRSSEYEFDRKDVCEQSAIDHIGEMYY